MKRVLVPLAAFCILTLAACGEQKARSSTSSGTLALTSDDALLYALDQDSDTVGVIDAQTHQKVAAVQVGRLPEAIVIGSDDTAYVANRGNRSLSVIKRGDWEHVESIAVGVEPVGLALSSDNKTLYVVNQSSTADAEIGSLMAVDTVARQVKWELELGPDPRAIALKDDTRAVISLFRPGDVLEVDLAAQKVVRSGTTLNAEVNRDPSGADLPPTDPFKGSQAVKARGVSALVVAPDDSKVFATTGWNSEATLNGGIDTGSIGGGSYGGGGGCNGGGGAVVSPGIATFDSESMEPQVDPVRECFNSEARDYPATRLVDPRGTQPLQGPSAVVIDRTGTWLYVAHRESNNVAIVPTTRGSGTSSFTGLSAGVQQVVKVSGKGPSGIALSADGKKLFVHNQFTHDVSVLETGGEATGGKIIETAVVKIAEPTLPKELEEGRILFFAADDSRMNSPAVGISCGSCHLEGREDGHVWNFTEGPRQTPSLAGRKLSVTAPFHWGGEHTDFASFVDHTVGTRMGGTGLNDTVRETQLFAFIESMQPADNPNQFAKPTEAQLRGAQVFQKANCQSCHAGEAFTNNTNADVGTYVTQGAVVDDPGFFSQTGGLNTPSLLGLARTAPYLHDGSALTLRERIVEGKSLNKHGLTASLSDAEVSDLVEYLKSL